MYRHRIQTPLKEAIEQGKKYFFIYGNGVSDCFLENFYTGVYDFQNSLRHYFLGAEELKCDTFIVVADQVTVLSKQENDICDITSSYLRPKRQKDDMDDNMEDAEGEDESEREISSEVSGLEQQLSATDMALYNHIALIKRKISMQEAEDTKKTAVFFKDFEWMASLYITPNEDSVKYIRMLKEFLQLNNCYVVVTIENIELLANYNFETKGSNIIYVGNPSAGEIKYAYLRKFLSASPIINNPSLDMFEELDNISHAVSSSNKNLREALYVLDKLVIESGKTCLKREDFEIAVKKITEEKVYLDDVIIDEKEKKAILNAVDAFIENDEPSEYKKGIILTGPPGTGKTEIVKALANEKNCYFLAPKLSDLKGEFVGQTGIKVKRIFDEARANSPTIMFIDEADTVFPKRDASANDTDSFNKDMVNQFLQEIEGISTGSKNDKIFIIAATNRPAMIDLAIQSRLSERIIIGLPNGENRIRIFDSKLKKDKFTIRGKSYQSEIMSKTINMSGRDITNFVKELKTAVRTTRFKTVSNLGDNEESKQLLLSVMEKNEQKIIDDLQKRVPVKVVSPNYIMTKLEDIIGYEDIKRSICRQADYICANQEERAKARKFDIKISKGVLLYGPPGNAKTKLAEAVAKEKNFYFIKVISKDFVSNFIANQLDNLQIIFDQAILLSQMCSKYKGVLLFFDEIDSLASTHMDSAIRGTLLDYLAAGDGDNNVQGMGIRSANSKILLMAATNHYERLDEAVIRRGRIDEHIYMDNPSQGAGEKILRELIKRDKYVEDVKNEVIADIYARLIKDNIRPSGSDIVNTYQDIKAEAFFMQRDEIKDNGKICIDDNVLKSYFGNDIARSRGDNNR